MPTPELDVLIPVDLSDDADDFFVLSNAQVVYESNGKLASLLSAYADTPLRVEGRLELLRGQSKYLVKKPYKPTDIVIRNVTRYSYGQMDDGELVVWALGEAGWFKIQPARHYQAIHDGMVEAIALLYFLADIYSGPRKRGGGPGAQLIFQEYAEDERFACPDIATAEQIFHAHHQFLMMSFLDRAQGIGWSNTPIYQYLKRQYPIVFEATKARKEGRYDEIPKQTRGVNPIAMTTSAPQQSRSARSSSRTLKPSARPKKDDNWWEAAAIYEFIKSAVNKRILRPGRSHITVERVADLMIKRYEIDEVETARNVLLVHAQNLCYKFDHARGKKWSFLTEEPLYRELQMQYDLPAVDLRKALAVELRPRKHQAVLERAHLGASDSEEDAIVTPQRPPEGRRKKGRLSVLRPVSSKYSGKGKTVTPGKGYGNQPESETDSSEDKESSAEAEAEVASDSDMVVEEDASTQALSPSREKRKFVDNEDDQEEKGRRKRAASESVSPESPPSTEEDDDDKAAAEADNVAQLPLRNFATNGLANGKPVHAEPKSNLVAPIVSTPLPTYEANGPRDSWICTFDGCGQRIYGASKPMGRQLITEHLEDHAKGRQDVVGIVWRENQKLALPVNNLLKKIREMSESQMPLFPPVDRSSPALQPEPIRRML